MNEKKRDKQLYRREKERSARSVGEMPLKTLAQQVLELSIKCNRRDIFNAAKKLLNTIAQTKLSSDAEQKNYLLMKKFLSQMHR